MSRLSPAERLARYGPTVDDRVRLGDTDLWVRVAEDRQAPGDEPIWGYAKTIRPGSTQGRPGPSELDVVVAGAFVLDPVVGAVKADIGIKDGRIVGVGRAGNPGISDGIELPIGPHTQPIMGYGLIATPGAVDSHVHLISPALLPAALSGGVSGIHGITRFPVDGLNTRIAGTVDFVDLPAENPVERSYFYARETTEEALAQAGISGDFGGPLFLAAPPIEPEWSARFALADRAPASQRPGDAYDRFLSVLRGKPDPALYEAWLFGAISERLADRFGTRGLPEFISPRSLLVILGLVASLTVIGMFRQRFYLDPDRERGFHWRAVVLQFAKWPAQLTAIWQAMSGTGFGRLVLAILANEQQYGVDTSIIPAALHNPMSLKRTDGSGRWATFASYADGVREGVRRLLLRL